MRKFTIIVSALLLSITTNILAVEPVDEQQVMLYYRIPLGGSRPADKRHGFGLRLDRTTHAPGEVVQFHELMNRQAMLDFRMGHEGLQYLKIQGVNYAENPLIARAAEEEGAVAGETGEPEDEPAVEPERAATEGGVTGEGAEEAATEEEPAEDKTIVQKTLDELPAGIIIGVGILIGILAGAGG